MSYYMNSKEKFYQNNAWIRWLLDLFGYRPWRNPKTDIRDERKLDLSLVDESIQIEWPEEIKDWKVDFTPPAQKPYKGSVGGGVPVQLLDPSKTKKIMVHNQWRGTLIENGVDTGIDPGDDYYVDVPVPVSGEWAIQGYPNENAGGDRHWYGIEPDGTAHEMISFWTTDWSCHHYAKYAPDGTILHRVDPGGSVVKGNIRWTGVALNRNDKPHRLGLVFKKIGKDWDNTYWDGNVRFGEPDEHWSDGEQNWEYPRYGQWYRLSSEAYVRLSAKADAEQQAVLDSAYYFGFIPYDRGGALDQANVGMIAGSQWVGSTIGELDIKLKDLELVTQGR